jgi:hypothetical protein
MVKHRNMLVQVILFMITFGIYGIYWFYVTTDEMKHLVNDPDISPGLLTFLTLIPILNLYALYKYSDLFEEISDSHFNRWILFILWIVFCPAVWAIVQLDLNQKAESLNPALA